MRCAVTGGTISVANRRSTRQAQLWPGTGPCCDEEYDRTKLNSYLVVTQEKTKQPLRIKIVGELEALIERIRARKTSHKMVTAALLVNVHGKRLTGPALRSNFDRAKRLAIKEIPSLALEVQNFWFYDLRAKAADDTSDERGEQAASDLLGHESVRTTQRHYLRRGKIVTPTR